MPLKHIRPGLRLFGALVVAALVVACTAEVAIALLRPEVLPEGLAQLVAGLVTPHYTAARLLAKPPALGKTIDLDAYLSPAGQALCGTEWNVIVADQPFTAELAVLGTARANALPIGGWLVAARAPTPLPYRARLRGRLEELPASDACSTVRVFTIDRVVRVYEDSAPAGTADWTAWPRQQDAEAGYSVPCPPGWRAEPADGGTLALYAPQWPAVSITVRAHPGETRHDPYEPELASPLLQGQPWSIFAQASASGPSGPATQGLVGYRIERAGEPDGRVTSVLFSAHGRTYELSVRYPLGFAVSQPVLDAFSAIVAGFGFAAPPAPSPTPPVRQALGPGPFLSEEDALTAGCGCLKEQVDTVLAQQLVSEAQARQLGSPCAMFRGHTDGVWALTVETPLATRTGTLRLYLDAVTGRELCREEVDPKTLPKPSPEGAGGLQAPGVSASKPKRWIEVILGQQTVIAWEGDTAVRRMLASTGLPGTPTVTGSFHVYLKTVSTPMSGPGYYLPDVPHTMFFFEGYSLHGAYWHNNFGTPMSHGCVNLSLGDAAWLFQWASPRLAEGEWSAYATPCNPGTLVVVHD